MKAIKDIKENIIQQYYTESVGKLNKSLFPVKDNPTATSLFNKTERLRMALLLVASFLEKTKQESLETLADNLLFGVIDFFSSSSEEKNTIYKNTLFSMIKISEVLDALFVKGKLSIENVAVIKDALIEVQKLFEKTFNETQNEIQLNQADFLAVDGVGLKSILSSSIKDTQNIEDIKDNSIEVTKDKRQNIEVTKDRGHKEPQKTASSTQTTAQPSENIENRKPRLHDIKNVKSRRLQILDTLQIYGALNATEIRAHVKNWSPKTIQRELASMASEGIVKKSGSGRWTKYSINLD